MHLVMHHVTWSSSEQIWCHPTVHVCTYLVIQPLSPAVSRGNNSYNTNSLSASMATIIRNQSHMLHVRHLLPMATIRGQRLFRSRASDSAATIRGWWLIGEASIQWNMVKNPDKQPGLTTQINNPDKQPRLTTQINNPDKQPRLTTPYKQPR